MYHHTIGNILEDINDWKNCIHVADYKNGTWVGFQISKSSHISPFYQCIICHKFYYNPEEIDELPEPRLCSKKCADRFGH